MFYHGFYVVSPNEKLKEKARNEVKDEDLRDLILENCLWQKDQGGISATTPQEHMDDFKTTYVKYMKIVWQNQYGCDGFYDNFEESVEGFDAWWDLEYFQSYENTYENAIKEIEQYQ